jgi:hypothetical protein
MRWERRRTQNPFLALWTVSASIPEAMLPAAASFGRLLDLPPDNQVPRRSQARLSARRF